MAPATVPKTPAKTPAKTGTSQKRARSPEASTTRQSASTSKTDASHQPAKRARASTLISGASETSKPKTTEAQPARTSGAPIAASKVVVDDEDGDEDGEGEDDDESDENEEDETDPKHFFPGSYDLYGMELPFMHGVYSPKAGPVNPEALYKTILKYQAKKDRTANITIPEGYDTSGKDGSFKSRIFCDPMEEMPFDVSLSSFQIVQKTSFRSQYGRPADAWEGPPIQGRLAVTNGGCGIASSSGTLTMQPLWKKRDADGELMELFEGTLNFRVSYSGMYSRKGHGSGQKQTIPFWGVRAAE